MTSLVLLAALGFATSVAFVPDILSAATAPRWAVLALMIPLVLMAARRVYGLGWAAVILAPMALTVLWAPDRLTAIDELIHWSIFAGAILVGASFGNLGALWVGLQLGVALSVVLAVFQWFGYQGIAQAVPPAGLFINKNLLAEASMVELITAVGYWPRILVAVAALGVVIATSKAVFGAMILTGAIWLWRRNDYPLDRVIAAATVLGLVVAVVVFFLIGHPSAAARLEMWLNALGNATILGHGLGSFSTYFPE